MMMIVSITYPAGAISSHDLEVGGESANRSPPPVTVQNCTLAVPSKNAPANTFVQNRTQAVPNLRIPLMLQSKIVRKVPSKTVLSKR